MGDHPLAGFSGYRIPGYTQIPDQLLDDQLHLLTHAELKVLLYIMRHTFGYKRDGDHLSARQIAEGLVRRDGTRVDHGTGCEIATVRRTVKRLEELGLITVRRDRTADGDAETNFYTVRLAEGGGVATTPPGCSHDTRGVVSPRHPTRNRTSCQETTESEPDLVASLTTPDDSDSDSLRTWATDTATALGKPSEARQLTTWARRQAVPLEVLQAAGEVTGQQAGLRKPVAYLQTVAKVMVADRVAAAEAGKRKKADTKRAALAYGREVFADKIIGGSWQSVESIVAEGYGKALAGEVVRELQGQTC